MERGAAADQQQMALGVAAFELAVTDRAQLECRTRHPPAPRLGVVDGGGEAGELGRGDQSGPDLRDVWLSIHCGPPSSGASYDPPAPGGGQAPAMLVVLR